MNVEFNQEKGQIAIADYYYLQLSDPAKIANNAEKLEALRRISRNLEDQWNHYEESLIDESSLPKSAEEFVDWYQQQLIALNQSISPFIQFLSKEANTLQLAYYVCMEELVDGSFDDMMALIQIGMPVKSKMAVAENYWDEMGNGDFSQVHTTMFEQSASYLKNILQEEGIQLPAHPPKECLMNGNVLLMWGMRREYLLRLIGAAGLIEGSAPIRFTATTNGMVRNNLPEHVIAYHREHISIDARHGEDWLQHVIKPYAHAGKNAIREMALGVKIRYRISEQYYKYLMEHMLNLDTVAVA